MEIKKDKTKICEKLKSNEMENKKEIEKSYKKGIKYYQEIEEHKDYSN